MTFGCLGPQSGLFLYLPLRVYLWYYLELKLSVCFSRACLTKWQML